MAKEGQSRADALGAISSELQGAARKGPPPVHLWNPPDCGDIDMRIAVDGSWFYQGSRIARPALVRLFASVLKREGERYVLVTPVEKCGIVVEDAPFLAVEMGVDASPDDRDPPGHADAPRPAPTLSFRTNVDDWVVCDAEHPLRFEREDVAGGLKPYLHVRRGLWAKLTRPLLYELVGRGEEREIDGRTMFGVASGAVFFPMAPADSLKDALP